MLKAGAEPPRGRPRGFDVEAAVETAQKLFEASGYDRIGVAALTDAMGINPPSFYAAFGSKAKLFDRVLDRYQASRLPADAHLRPGTDPACAVRSYLEGAARVFAAEATTAGCLILESARGVGCPESTAAARRRKQVTRGGIAAFLSASYPEIAGAIADFVIATATGLSAAAREGAGVDRLLATADIAARAVAAMLVHERSRRQPNGAPKGRAAG